MQDVRCTELSLQEVQGVHSHTLLPLANWHTQLPKLLLLSSDHFAWQPPPSVYEWWSCKVLWEDWKSAVEVKVLLLSTSPVKVQYSWMKFVFQVFIFAPLITYDRWCKWDNFKGFLFCPWKWLIQCIAYEHKALSQLILDLRQRVLSLHQCYCSDGSFSRMEAVRTLVTIKLAC